MNHRFLRRTIALLLAVVLLCTSCRQINDTAAELAKVEGSSLKEKVTNLIKTEGEKLLATTMSLTKTEGTVDIATKKGRVIPPVEGQKLYSGYGMRTQAVSYAWINLDHVKLVKMDETSEIDIEKKGNDLEIYIRSGALFFHVTEPLEEDESMDIRTSSMIVGIRGTCGWVEAEDEDHAQVYILEGRVSVTAPDTGEEVSVSAGETAEIRLRDNEESEIIVTDFSVEDIPEFIMPELEEDEQLAQAVLDASGLDVLNPLDESADEHNDSYMAVLEQYRTVISHAASYFNDIRATGKYWYALVKMQAEDSVPTLLLKAQVDNYIEYVRIFQYDPGSGSMIQPEEMLAEGVATAGGYRGTLSLAGDGNGMFSLEWWSGTGDATLNRATLDGNILYRDKLWEDRIDRLPAEFSDLFREIEWYDMSDTSALDNWTDDRSADVNRTDAADETVSASSAAAAETAEVPTIAAEAETMPTVPDESLPSEPTAVTEAVLPAEEGRIVFTGTVRLCSYDEVVALQGSPDPNAPWADTSEMFLLILLDAPQTMTLGSSDPSIGMTNGTVSMIDVSGAGGLSQYNGQHHTFSVDPNRTRFPSDTSLPLGQPYTSDVHVLD